MRNVLLGLLTWGIAALSPVVAAAETDGAHRSPYAGQESRAIKSLSAKDVDDLLNGRGWGLAKAAELNRYPGPSHVLEMADAMALRPGQKAKVQALFEGMRARAMALGRQLVTAEQSLDRAFAGRTVSSENLPALVRAAARLRGELRLVHLTTHLSMQKILGPDQIAAYNRLRGYAGTKGGAHNMQHSK